MDLVQQLKAIIDDHGLWQEPQLLERNQYLKVQGSRDTNLYYVHEGSLRIFVIDEDEEHTIRFGYRDNLITALDSYISEGPSDLYIQALKKSVVSAVAKVDLVRLMNEDPAYLKLWYTAMEQLVYQQMERERDILTFSPQERYQRVLKRSPQLFQEIPHKYIASYLRMTPETLSRVKKS